MTAAGILILSAAVLMLTFTGDAIAGNGTGSSSASESENSTIRAHSRPQKNVNGAHSGIDSFYETARQIKSSIAENRKLSITGRARPTLSDSQKKNLAHLMAQTQASGGVHVRFSDRNGTPSLIKGTGLSAAMTINRSDMALSKSIAIRFMADNRDLLTLTDPVQELSVTRQAIDKQGEKHIHYQQVYRGVPIWGKEVAVHLSADDSVYLFQGMYEPSPRELGTEPVISEDEAMNAVREHLQINHDGISSPEYELVFYTLQDGTMLLAYKINIQPAVDKRWIYFINAEDGSFIHRINNIHSQVVPATGIDLNTISRNFNAWLQGGTYYTIDPSTPLADPPYDPVGKGPNSRGDMFILSAGNGAGDPLYYVTSPSQTGGWDASAVSASYNTKVVYDYYKNTFSRNSIDGNNMNLLVIIHFQSDYENAFWNGSWMVYGDGGQVFKPLAGALDVAAHEMSHGVIENTANLIYENQSGALNESFADVFAVMVDRDDWRIGEDITLVQPGHLRDMANPANGLGAQPAKMSEYQPLPNTETGDWGGVHINSGIPNRAAYLIADGLTAEGLGTSIGRNRTEQIYYRALTTYLLASSQFLDARRALIQSAEDLYGTGSLEVTAVTAAWDIVEVVEGAGLPGGQKPSPADPVSGDDLMVYLYPSDGTHADPYGTGETYSLYVQTFPSPFQGYSSSQDSLLDTDVSPRYTRPAVYTDIGGTGILYVGDDNNVYSINLDGSGFSQITTTGNIWSIALSPDGRLFSYTSTDTNDNNIYVVDLICDNDLTVQVVPSDYQDDSSESTNTVLYADSLAFDYTGNILVFDALNCISLPGNLCSEGNGYRYWSIGFLDIDDGSITSPFPNQNPDLDFGYPSFAYNNNFIVTMDVLDYSVSNTILSMVRTFNRETQEIADVANPNLGDNTTGVWGIPSFWGDDDYITIQQLHPGISGKAVRIPIDSTWAGGPSDEQLNDFDVAMPIMHRKAVRTTQGILQSNSSTINFGSITSGSSSTQTVTLTNTGSSNVALTCMDISGSTAFTISNNNVLLSGSEQAVLEVTYSPGQVSGGESAVLTLTNDVDNSTLKIALTGIASSKGGGGGGGCFIATAAYGSYMADEVMLLRQFRDKWLIPNSAGRAFVDFYYKYAPPFADFISGNNTMRFTSRLALTPLVFGIKYPAVSGLIMAGISMVLFSFMRIRRKRNRLVSLRFDGKSKSNDNI